MARLFCVYKVFSFLSRRDAAVLSQRDGGLLKLAVGMVEDDAGVEAAALERGLEMEMLRRGATRAACETDDLARGHSHNRSLSV